MKTRTALLLSLLLSLTTPAARSETVKDREGAVRQDRAKMENDARWIYNDFEKGFAEAKRTGKPLMVVLRCVPCMSCMGIDAGILEATDLNPLYDQFVCVRVINANALDLGRFQFDYDLSLSTLFFNGDGTVYGRFASWTHQRDKADRSTAGFRAALEGVLEIHKSYPANQAALAGKQGKDMPYKVPVEFPELAKKYGRNLDWEGKVAGSCVHCHMIGEAYRWHYRNQGQPLPMELIYPMPTPRDHRPQPRWRHPRPRHRRRARLHRRRRRLSNRRRHPQLRRPAHRVRRRLRLGAPSHPRQRHARRRG
jgi:serine protease Do